MSDLNTHVAAVGTTALEGLPASGDSWLITTATTTYADGWSNQTGGSYSIGLRNGTGGTVAYARYANTSTYEGGKPSEAPLWLYATTANPIYITAPAGTMGYSGTVVANSSGPREAKCAVSSIATSGYLTFQPASGESWMITEFLSQYWDYYTNPVCRPYYIASYYDGSTTIPHIYGYYTNMWGAEMLSGGHRRMINNSVYGRMQNTLGSTQYIGYSGVRTV